MLAPEGANHHFEFTISHVHPVPATPTKEDLVVFYIPSRAEWDAACSKMLAAGFLPTASFNPYWDLRGRTFEDHDGYRTVLQNAAWTSDEPTSGRLIG